MKKPYELSARKYVNAVYRLNSELPRFPDATDASKFPEVELLSILEWSLPDPWRRKFDYDNYVPTEHSKARLIAECEVIERNEVTEKKDKNENKKSKDEKSAGKKKNMSEKVELRISTAASVARIPRTTPRSAGLFKRKTSRKGKIIIRALRPTLLTSVLFLTAALRRS